jgi:thiamine pyrophosphokinase
MAISRPTTALPNGIHTVIFTGGLLRTGKAVEQALTKPDLLIAADSGADTAVKMGYYPSVVIGDLDSISPETKKVLEQRGCAFVVSPEEKDQTDTELAVRYAVARHATRITVLGGIEGDRIDHILANIVFTAGMSVPVIFVNGATTAWVEKGPRDVSIKGNSADLLSLLPLTPKVTGVHTAGLGYALEGKTLSMTETRGISNVLTSAGAGVKFSRGLLLFVHIDTSEPGPYR